MPTRCKFVCVSVTKRKGWRKESEFVYDAELSAVTGGSEENEAFWEATPNGSLKVGTVKSDLFEVGRDYYLDITPAD